MSYNQLTLTHFDQPQHLGCFTDDQQSIACGQIAALGQTLQLQMKFDDKNHLKAARFKANAEPYIVAALSIICEQLTGQTIDQCRKFCFQSLASSLNIPTEQKYCIILVEDVVNAAIDDFIRQNDTEA